jgi:Phage integrase family
MLRHACGYKLANDGHDTRAIQAYLGHRNIQNTTRYTALAPQRFKEFFRDRIGERGCRHYYRNRSAAWSACSIRSTRELSSGGSSGGISNTDVSCLPSSSCISRKHNVLSASLWQMRLVILLVKHTDLLRVPTDRKWFCEPAPVLDKPDF